MFKYNGNYIGFKKERLYLYSFSGKFIESFLWGESKISLFNMLKVQTCKHDDSEVFCHDIEGYGTRNIVYKCNKCQRYRNHYYIYDIERKEQSKAETRLRLKEFGLEETKNRLIEEKARLEKRLQEVNNDLYKAESELQELVNSQKSQN